MKLMYQNQSLLHCYLLKKDYEELREKKFCKVNLF